MREEYTCDYLFRLYTDEGISIAAIAKMRNQSYRAALTAFKSCGIPTGIVAERIKEDWYVDPKNKKMIILKLNKIGVPAKEIMRILDVDVNVYRSIIQMRLSLNTIIQEPGDTLPDVNWWKRPNISMGELIYFNQVLRMRAQEIARMFDVSVKDVKHLFKKYKIFYVNSNKKYAAEVQSRRTIKNIIADLKSGKERSLSR